MKIKVGVREAWERLVEIEVDYNASNEEILKAASDFIEFSDEGETNYAYCLEPDEWVIYR
jgi:hypothetical protein